MAASLSVKKIHKEYEFLSVCKFLCDFDLFLCELHMNACKKRKVDDNMFKDDSSTIYNHFPFLFHITPWFHQCQPLSILTLVDGYLLIFLKASHRTKT